MKKGKGLSLEEKRTRMLNIFTDGNTFFHLKEIEKLAVNKGITFQSVKDVLDSLVSDDLVEAERVGNSTYYFSFASKVLNAKKNKEINLTKTIEELTTSIAKIEEDIKHQKSLRKETAERQEKLNELEALRKEEEDLDQELKDYEMNDPVKYKQYEKENKLLLRCFETITDNILICDRIIRNRGFGKNLSMILPDEDFCGIFDEEE